MVASGKKTQLKLALRVCAHCSLCAESCFMYMKNGRKPEYIPSYKMIHSIGLIHKKGGKLTQKQWDEALKNAWKRCVLCMRCYCPLGIHIPGLIAMARDACRSNGQFPDFAEVKA